MTQKIAEGPQGGLPPWKEGEKIDLKIAHWCLWGPGVSGMYETTRELIMAENQIEGVLAGICETPEPNDPEPTIKAIAMGGKIDPRFPNFRTQDWGWAMKWADIHMIHSTMSNKVAELKPKAYFQHGCFHRNQLVRMPDGSMRRYNRIRRGELVLSRNKFGSIEPKIVTDIGPNGEAENWIKVIPEEGPSLTCTEDHPFYTSGGEIQAKDLKSGVRVLSNNICFSPTQREIILGANLGDAYVDPNALRFSHKHKDYNDIIASFFSGFRIYRRDYSTGYGHKVERVDIGLKRNQIPRSGSKTSYNKSPFRKIYSTCSINGRKTLTDEWLNGLTWISMAILYLDDGNVHLIKYEKADGEIIYYPTIDISVCDLNLDDANKLSRVLKEKFGLNNTVSNREDYPRIHINRKSDARRFFDNITKVFPIPPSLAYKIPEEYLGRKPPHEDGLHFEETSILIEKVVPLKMRSQRWAMTVEGNHNYYSGMCLVANTVEASLENDLEKNTTSLLAAAEWVQRFEATFVTSRRAFDFWSPYDHTGEKVHLIPKGIDLDWWQRSTTAQELDGEPSVLYGEIWRSIKHPYHLIFAINEIFKTNPKVKFNPWGLNYKIQFWNNVMNWTQFTKFLGKRGLRGLEDYPSHWYSRGDVYVSTGLYGDPSRSHQEALACGCPSICWDTDPYGDCHAYKYAKPFDIKDMARKIMETWNKVQDDREGVANECRSIAERHFNIKNETAEIVRTLRKVVSER